MLLLLLLLLLPSPPSPPSNYYSCFTKLLLLPCWQDRIWDAYRAKVPRNGCEIRPCSRLGCWPFKGFQLLLEKRKDENKSPSPCFLKKKKLSLHYFILSLRDIDRILVLFWTVLTCHNCLPHGSQRWFFPHAPLVSIFFLFPKNWDLDVILQIFMVGGEKEWGKKVQLFLHSLFVFSCWCFCLIFRKRMSDIFLLSDSYFSPAVIERQREREKFHFLIFKSVKSNFLLRVRMGEALSI